MKSVGESFDTNTLLSRATHAATHLVVSVIVVEAGAVPIFVALLASVATQGTQLPLGNRSQIPNHFALTTRLIHMTIACLAYLIPSFFSSSFSCTSIDRELETVTTLLYSLNATLNSPYSFALDLVWGRLGLAG